jgi:hypothetical protein
MKPIYELVTAAELKVGDVVTWNPTGGETEVLGLMSEDNRGDIRVQFHAGSRYFSEKFYRDVLLFRRLPATDDPRVLRRACELLAEWYANVADRDEKKELDDAIQTAIEMLETEA